MKKKTFAWAACAAALFTAACGGQGSPESFDDEPGFVTATTDTETNSDATSDTAKEAESETETTTETVEESPFDDISTAKLVPETEGEQFSFGGETGTICLIGDGYQMNVLAANDATSCDVASDVFNQVTDGMHPGDDSVWDKSGSSVTVPGRGTGQPIQFDCEEEGNILACRSNDGGAVFMYQQGR